MELNLHDPVADLLNLVFLVAVPAAVLVWAARERGQTRWYGVFGLLSLLGLFIGMLLIDRHPRPPQGEG